MEEGRGTCGYARGDGRGMPFWSVAATPKLRWVIDVGRASVAGASFTSAINERRVSCGRFVNGCLNLDPRYKERSLAGRWSTG